MWKFELRKVNRIAEFFKKLPRTLSEHAFFFSVILITIAMLLGALTFYKYSFLAEKKEPKVSEQPLILDEEVLQEILEIRLEHQKRLDQAQFKKYPNPFLVD